MPAAPAIADALPLAVPVAADARLGYVLRHFWQVYGPEQQVSFGPLGSGCDIEIEDGAGNFFEETDSVPPPPAWRAWRGQRLPFFFARNSPDELLTRLPGRAILGVDVISAAFFLLSGWQEYFSSERDQHGRFPYNASVQFRYGFVGIPVVNYYFDLLKTAVEHVTGQPLAPRRWATDAPLAAFISHDIDMLRGSWKAPVKRALRGGRLVEAIARLWRRLRHPDAWDNLEQVAAQTGRYGGKSTFFVLPCPGKAPDGTPNADYRLTPRLRARLHRLAAEGHEIGLHGSIGSSLNFAQLRAEQQQLAAPGKGHRFHYLKWDPRRTPALLDAAGFDYDSTLGFAEHFGFRHSYCHPFQPFDFATHAAHRFVEIPLVLMDATLHHPNYLQLAAEEVLPALRPVLAEVEKFGGVAGILWHNDHFDAENLLNGPAQFHELMLDLQQRRASFLTGTEVVAHYQADKMRPNGMSC
jgi:peptidoglycan/xylan/chitin deacetylase (PgdA/CDA1 family)